MKPNRKCVTILFTNLSGSHFEKVEKVFFKMKSPMWVIIRIRNVLIYIYENTNINNFKYTGWFKLHIWLNFKYENIVFRCTIPLICWNSYLLFKVSSKISYCSFFWFPSYVNKINQSIVNVMDENLYTCIAYHKDKITTFIVLPQRTPDNSFAHHLHWNRPVGPGNLLNNSYWLM